jgi:hypothetical protein
LVGGDAAVRDFARGLHLSEGRETGERSSQETGALGEAEDISDHQFAKHSEP